MASNTQEPTQDLNRTRGSVVAEALAAADLRTLVTCLFHMTGEDRWLSDRFRPSRDVRLIADPDAGFSDEIKAEILAAAQDWLETGGDPAIVDPGPEQFAEMVSVYLGETVAPEYVPMIREDFGFDSGDTQWSDRLLAGQAGLASAPDVIVVGTGASGLCLASKLVQLGLDVRVVEKNADVGGTWFENRYPGCGVDTPNHFYSFSFAPNPDWQHFFSPRDELLDYMMRFADQAGLRDRIEFDTTVTAAQWDDEASEWTVTLQTNGVERTETARVVVAATGHFNQPTEVSFAGQENFEGEILHTARWPDDVDLSGKRVAIIGTGASSMQLAPTIAEQVESLTIFQRSAQWARPIPEYNLPVAPDSHWLFSNIPLYDRWYRFGQFWRYGDGLLRFLAKDPKWEHPERSLNRINDRHREEMTSYITEKLSARPDLVERCVPDYPPFGKRILIDNGWFETICRPDVELVTDTIEEFTTDGIRTADGSVVECDVIILATGFNVTDLAARLNIRGSEGKTLREDWADENPRAHLGMAVPGFPNFFVMYGPNTNMGHGGSGIWLAETQTRYITDRLVEMAENNVDTIDCIPARRDDYSSTIDDMHADLVWTHPGVTTYYRNRNGQVRSPMPFRLVDYWSQTREASLSDFVTTPLPAG